MHILLVEDNSLTVDALTDKLQSIGHTTYFVGDGLSALTYLAAPTSTRPGLILLDYKLPGMDGDELLTKLESHSVWHTIPVLLMTAVGGLEQEQLRFKHGGIRILSKPFTFMELLQEIELISDLSK